MPTRRLRFTLRDLFWLVLVVALAIGWWMDHRRLTETVREWTIMGGSRVYDVSAFVIEPGPIVAPSP